MIKAILFDLDGTLLPMDMETFTGGYFSLLAKKAAPFGYEAKELVKNVWAGTKAMVLNDGSCTNEERFWQYFAGAYGAEKLKDRQMFDDFYANEFDGAKEFTWFNPKASETVSLCKELGFRTILATNPLFPEIATRKRITWAGFSPEDFEYFTTYENSCFCKPNPRYYEELLKKMDLKGGECLMVGNDAEEDMIAKTLGMEVFLLTDCLVNAKQKDISGYRQGSFDKLQEVVRSLDAVRK